MQKDYLEETIETYNSKAKQFQESRAPFAQVKEMSLFQSRVPGKKILEIGCGPGRDARIFVDAGFDLTGIDAAEGLLKLAKRDVPEATFLHMDMRALTFPPEIFDGIWCSATFHHLKREDMVSTLQKMYGVLKEDGVCYISVKTGEGEGVDRDKRLDSAPRFFSYMPEDEFLRIIGQTDFLLLEKKDSTLDDMQRNVQWCTVYLKK